MACRLTASSHYPNQCWFLMSEVLWHSYESNFTASDEANILYNKIENWYFVITATCPRGQWVKPPVNHPSRCAWRGRGVEISSGWESCWHPTNSGLLIAFYNTKTIVPVYDMRFYPVSFHLLVHPYDTRFKRESIVDCWSSIAEWFMLMRYIVFNLTLWNAGDTGIIELLKMTWIKLRLKGVNKGINFRVYETDKKGVGVKKIRCKIKIFKWLWDKEDYLFYKSKGGSIWRSLSRDVDSILKIR